MSPERRTAVRVSASRIAEMLAEEGARSLADPLMGVPIHLRLLADRGVRVAGADLVDWYVIAGQALVAPPAVPLAEPEIAALIERDPAREYDEDRFLAWEGAFLREEQCRYLALWRENVLALPDPATRGIAVWGLWHVLCYWLAKAERPDAMLDVPPSELAWDYLLESERWSRPAPSGNTVVRASANELVQGTAADALFVVAPPRSERRRSDSRIWMWEAWWRGDPYFDIERAYASAPLGGSSGTPDARDAALGALVASAAAYRLVLLQTTAADREHLERIARDAGRAVETRAYGPSEIYVIARA